LPIYEEDLAYIEAVAFGNLASGAAPEILRRMHNAAIPVRRIVDAGCGAGPLSTVLIGAGFEVIGIDSSSALLDHARAAVPAARLIRASIYDVEFPACETILAVGEPLTYHAEPEFAETQVRCFFERAASVLPIGGLLIFDIIEQGDPPLSNRIWRSGDDWAILVETTEDVSGQTLRRDIQTFRRAGALYRRGQELHRVKIFDPSAVSDWLRPWFIVVTDQSYGQFALAPRRRAFFAERVM
jgi:SAM-dependent methyltransferase